MRYLLIALLLFSCGKSKKKDDIGLNPPTRYEELEQKAELYKSLWSGWIPGCDSLLFTSLSAVGGLRDVVITDARDENGKWFRTPEKDCYPDRSKSTISKDMLMGLLWWAWHSERADVIQQVMDDHRPGYVMGEGPVSRTLMTPSQQGLYARSLLALGGKVYEPEVWYPQVYLPTRGYESALQVLGILLDCKTTGDIDAKALTVLRDHYERNPRNPLFSFAYHIFYTGDLNETVNTLLDDPVFPNGRLPTSADRCEPWIIQRELDPSDWEGCPEEGLTHSGGELLFLFQLIKDEVE